MFRESHKHLSKDKLTADVLKAALQNHLRDNGVIHFITAQFRRHIVDKLLVNRKLTGNIESGSEDDGTNIT